MGVCIYGISLPVFNLIITLNMRREIPYVQATIYYFVCYINILMKTFLAIFQRFSKIVPKAS